MKEKLAAFERLLGIMDDLRQHCPWDREQTIDSLRNLTIEETYELADAITTKDWDNLQEELGDVMLHLVFYSKIASEQSRFDVADVLNGVCDKLIRRHPHIYADVKVNSTEEVKQNWETIKQAEGKQKKGVLSGVPVALPAMIKAYRMQDKAAQVGFDWKESSRVLDKLQEELVEFEHAKKKKQSDEMEQEFGDILFTLINYARHMGIDPESALEKTNTKFKSRFEFIEREAKEGLNALSLDEMEALWNQAKSDAQSH